MMLGIAAMSASAQVNYKMQVACNPQDVKTYDTNRLRSSFLMEKSNGSERNQRYLFYVRPFYLRWCRAYNKRTGTGKQIDPLKAKFFP